MSLISHWPVAAAWHSPLILWQYLDSVETVQFTDATHTYCSMWYTTCTSQMRGLLIRLNWQPYIMHLSSPPPPPPPPWSIIWLAGLSIQSSVQSMKACTSVSQAWWRHQNFRVSGHLCGEFTGPPHKDQWRGTLMVSLICARIDGWVNTREAGDLRRRRAYYDVIGMARNIHGTITMLLSTLSCWITLTALGSFFLEAIRIVHANYLYVK